MHDDEETEQSWLEHWIVVGKVSEKAEESIGSVNGKVEPMYTRSNSCYAMAVCFVDANPPDDDYAIVVGQQHNSIRYDVYTPDEHVELVIYSIHPNLSLIQSDVTGLHMVTLGEYYKIVDEEVKE